jgi:hypothetical protein
MLWKAKCLGSDPKNQEKNNRTKMNDRRLAADEAAD